MGQIRLKKSDGKDFISSDYFLIDERDPESKKIVLNQVPEGLYTGIEFILGVDSLHNCSGIQEGALDPVNGMFWAWNTGYIFLKLDGHAPASKTEGQLIEFHIGGYKQPVNSIRKIKLDFPSPRLLSNQNAFPVNIKADVLELFKTPVNIDFSTLSSVTDLHYATLIANNYADMFRLWNP